VSKSNWLTADTYTDQYAITVAGNLQVTAQRTDNTGGWGMNLQFSCKKFDCYATPFHLFRPADKFCAEPLTEAIFDAGFGVQLQLSPEA